MSAPRWGADAAVGVSQALAVLLVHLGSEEDRQLAAGALTLGVQRPSYWWASETCLLSPSSQPGRLSLLAQAHPPFSISMDSFSSIH